MARRCREQTISNRVYICICVYVGYILAYWKRRITRVNPVDGFIISTVRDFRDLQIRIYNSGVVLTRKRYSFLKIVNSLHLEFLSPVGIHITRLEFGFLAPRFNRI